MTNDTHIESKSVRGEPGLSGVQNENLVAGRAGSERASAPLPAKVRFLATTLPAASVTFGLFLLMGGLIAADFVPAEATEIREITSIIPEIAEEIELGGREPVELIKMSTPPPPPAVTIQKEDPGLPTPVIEWAPPEEVIFVRVQSPDIRPVAIADTDAKPLRPPVVTYPQRALNAGIEGECSVHFNVDVRGQPYEIEATCTNGMFEREAERAVGRVKFAPKIVKGRAQERKNVIYPLVFSIT